MARMIRAALPTLLLALLAGCGTPSQPGQMALSGSEALQIRGWLPEALKGQVAVAPVRGGFKDGFLWGSSVGAAALQQALDDSCRAAGLVPAMPPDAASRFELSAEFAPLGAAVAPAAGGVAGASGAALRYTLLDRQSGRIVYQRLIETRGEADFGDAVLQPAGRQRVATERALHANIGQMLRDLVGLRL